jgi:hypothetical protein
MLRPASALHWMELIYGAAACAIGIAALVFLLVAPLYGGASSSSATSCDSTGNCTTITTPVVHSTATLLQVNGSSDVLFLLGLLLLCLLAIAVSAALHSTLQRGTWLVILWIAAVMMVLFTLLGIFTIGIFLAPAALLALVAAVLGVRVQVAERSQSW